MKPADTALAVLVAVIWGLGFVFTRYALTEMSPSLLNLLRFAITALPCLLLPRPKLAWPVWIGISLLLVWQYLTQTYGIAHGVPAGLTAVIVQSQALFTVGFAAVLLGERPTGAQLAGIAVAACGLLMICLTVGYDFTVLAFAVTMTAPISFAFTNLLLRRARDVPMLDLFAWISLASLPPLALAAWVSDGVPAIVQSLTHLSPGVMGAMLALSVGSTTIGYWIWGRLLHAYSAAQVVPFALLVPFIGAGASSLVFGETFGPLRLTGMLIVVAGLAIMLLFGRARPPLPEVG
ncbi:EamA family transporter [Rhodopseudomonas palustris]|uniref:EamA family transporter n=1 Tax=Rhodopseudomonas palustris TaxID=1076 RepID=A0AAX3E3F4_RHOPL|nr:EamA family transporter [Rhodopseudomonas palustris]UYO41621.1 EamA family transporter [Rhodopseudomonas palustris]